MSGNIRKSRPRRKLCLKDLNSSITCALCGGYLIDAATLVDCPHSFCRSCLLKHFENFDKTCPTCKHDYKKRSDSIFRFDQQLQTLVYKMVPGLANKEILQRDDFYKTTRARASSSASEDSLLDEMDSREEWETSLHKLNYYSPDDSISLSLEYYQWHLDERSTDNSLANSEPPTKCIKVSDDDQSKDTCSDKSASRNENENDSTATVERRFLQCPAAVNMSHLQKFIRMKYGLKLEHKVDIIYNGEVLSSHFSLMDVAYTYNWTRLKPMRFFYRIYTPMKVQPIKIINTTTVNGNKQLQIVPADQPKLTTISPIASPRNVKCDTPVVPAPTSVPLVPVPPPVSPTPTPTPTPKLPIAEQPSKPPTPAPKVVLPVKVSSPVITTPPSTPTSHTNNNNSGYRTPTYNQTHTKESMLAQLQLQPSKKKLETHCVYEYQEPDDEEKIRFAEKRDREWQLMSTNSDGKAPKYQIAPPEHQLKLKEEEQQVQPHVSKKRKKSKHSRSDGEHKKRKLRAEMVPNSEPAREGKQDSIKLKMKLTSSYNGHHKHKHRNKSSSSSSEDSIKANSPPVDEALLAASNVQQLRGVRHKTVTVDEKATKVDEETPKFEPPPVEVSKKKPPLSTELPTSKQSSAKLRSDFSFSKPPPPPLVPKSAVGTVTTSGPQQNKVTVSSSSEKPAPQKQQAFLKTFQSYTKDLNQRQGEKVGTPPPAAADGVHKQRVKTSTPAVPPPTLQPLSTKLQQQKLLEQQIATLKQECTIEKTSGPAPPAASKAPAITPARGGSSEVKTISFVTPEGGVTTKRINPGFTVSKVENPSSRNNTSHHPQQQGMKRPAPILDKRPSLEITVIGGGNGKSSMALQTKPAPKRPLPDTIPLGRIMKSNHQIKAATSAAMSPRRVPDNNGFALDLRTFDPPAPLTNGATKTPNGKLVPMAPPLLTQIPPLKPAHDFKAPGVNQLKTAHLQQQPLKALAKMTSDKGLMNLQMLSTVASEQELHKPAATPKSSTPIGKQPMPNLQSISRAPAQATASAAMPTSTSSTTTTKALPNLAKIPQLQSISQYRLGAAGGVSAGAMRPLRPSQNQSIRNIPNPSLLVRQQSQNQTRFAAVLPSVTTTAATSTAAISSTTVTSKSVSSVIGGAVGSKDLLAKMKQQQLDCAGGEKKGIVPSEMRMVDCTK